VTRAPALAAAEKCLCGAEPLIRHAGMAGCDVIIHSAARIDGWGPWAPFQETNVEGQIAWEHRFDVALQRQQLKHALPVVYLGENVATACHLC